MLKTNIGRFRLISISEGISFLVLLGIAMPIKYACNIPEAVKYPGYLHGMLFILYVVLLLMTGIERKWSFGTLVLLFISSLLPFGFLFAERLFLKKQASQASA